MVERCFCVLSRRFRKYYAKRLTHKPKDLMINDPAAHPEGGPETEYKSKSVALTRCPNARRVHQVYTTTRKKPNSRLVKCQSAM
jgi:ribosomal protein S12